MLHCRAFESAPSETILMVKGKVMHFEIPVDEMDRARKFYADVFGWKIIAVPGPKPGVECTMVFGAKTDERGMTTEVGAINGWMVQRANPVKAPVITIDVDDMDAALVRIKRVGGKVLVPKTAMAEVGFTAYFEDSEGSIIGLWQIKKW